MATSVATASKTQGGGYYRYDDLTLDSMQPSDEWEQTHDEIPMNHSVPDDEKSASLAQRERYRMVEEEDAPEQDTLVSKQQPSIADYISQLTTSFTVEGSKIASNLGVMAVASVPKEDPATQETAMQKKVIGSSHSRCIIENTETIQERREQSGENQDRGVDDDCHRDQGTTSCSVEEISQISDLTFDFATVVTEHQQKVAQCATLPTISEVKQFELPQVPAPTFELPQLSAPACAAEVVPDLPKIPTPVCAQGMPGFEAPQLPAAACAEGVQVQARCSPGSTNEKEGNNHIMDYVFGLVDDALCKPITSSKSERKKLFMEAFLEESDKVVQLAKKNGNKDPLREASKHSASTRVADNRPTYIIEDDEDDIGDIPMRPVAAVKKEESTHSKPKSEVVDNIQVVDDQPTMIQAGFPTSSVDEEELTMDWSRMMSIAEKQLEAEEKTVVSVESKKSITSKLSGLASFFTGRKFGAPKNDEIMSNKREETKSAKTSEDGDADKQPKTTSVEKQRTKALRTSTSTHGTLPSSVVKELRELSALDSYSFEEQPQLAMASSLFQFVQRYIPNLPMHRKKKSDDCNENAKDELSSVDDTEDFDARTRQEVIDAAKVLLYVAFALIFVFWPSGVQRRENTELKPLKKKRRSTKEPSLLQLVSRKEDC